MLLRQRWAAALPLAGLMALSAYALAVDLGVPASLPSQQDWAEAAGAVRARARPGDGVQLWPAWAERGRTFVDAVPVFTDEDLAAADYAGIERLWLLSIPAAPNGRLAKARDALRSRGAAPAAVAERFGALSLEPWDLPGPRLLTDLVPLFGKPVHLEVGYVPRRCVAVAIGPPHAPTRVRVEAVVGARLHLRAGLVGERGYDRGSPPVAVVASIAGAPLPPLLLQPVIDPEPGWRHLDAPLAPLGHGAGPRELAIEISSPDAAGRWVCLAGWTTR